jgi:glucose/arabinose dehydrogenase
VHRSSLRRLFLTCAFLCACLLPPGCAPSNGAAQGTQGATSEQPAQGPPAAPEPPASRLPLHTIRLPQGFRIDVFTDQVPNARSLALSPGGVLYIGTRSEGKVYAVVDRDGDHRGERVYTLARGLTMPNGVAWRDGALYVAEVSRLLRFDGIDGRLENPPEPVVVRDDFPRDRHHGWKFIRFGPDGMLYVPVGAPCNICDEDNPIYASITRLSADGRQREIFARGVRNTVGFDWHPETGVLWFTDNGRDRMGDDVPPDELNHAPEKGLHFGFPYCHGRVVSDPEFGRKRPCAETVPPAAELAPHVAAIGMRFYRGRMFPSDYRGRIFIAEHGSWNRSEPIGYRVTMVRLDGDRAVSYEPFAEGWLQGAAAWGRPADVEELPDGSLLVSDDESGAIYRISYGERTGG